MAFFSTLSAIAAAVFTTANAVSLALSVGLQLLSSALRKKPKTDTGAIDAGLMVQANLAFGVPRGILFGQRDVGGTESDRFSYGAKNEYLTSISVLSSRPCSEFVGLKVFGEPVTVTGDPTVAECPVTSHFTGLGEDVRMYVRVFLGEDNTAFPAYINSLVSGRYDATDIGGKMCIAVWRAHHTNDDIDDEGKSFIPWTNGPPDCRWEMKGAKVFDPRVALATLADMTTWVYSVCPILHDFMTDLGIKDGAVGTPNEQVTIGNGYPEGLLDTTHIETMSDWSDGRNYGCHGMVRSGERGDQEEIWKTFNGQRLERPASVLTMPEAARPYYGAIDLSTMPAAKVLEYDEYGESTEVLNRMHGFYTEPAEGYGRKDLPTYTRPEWTAADDYIPREDELGLHFVTDGTQGLELIKQEAEITRYPATMLIGGLYMNYGQIPLGVLIDLDGTDIPAVNGRRWVVEQVSISALGPVSMSLREWPGDANLLLQPTDVQPLPVLTPVPRPWPWWDVGGNPTIPPILLTDISNVSAMVTGLRDGSLEFDDVLVRDLGLVSEMEEMQNANINNLETSGGAFTVTSDLNTVTGSLVAASPAEITTAPVTITESGGTSPYGLTPTWTKISGDTFTISDIGSGQFTGKATPASGSFKEAVYEYSNTDDASATATKRITFKVYHFLPF